jgi:DNA replication protein DnaC
MLARYEHASVADLAAPLNAWQWGGGRGVLLHGPAGTGKTHAAVALWRHFQSTHPATDLSSGTSFVSVARLFQEKRRQMDGRQSEGWKEPDWRRSRFVVFDDWDKVRMSEWVQEELFSIIDILYCRRVPIVVTSNLLPRDFARISGPYVTDRIKEMVVPIAMTGPSRRVAPSGSHEASHAEEGHGQSSPARGVDAGASHEPELVARADCPLEGERAAQAGVEHRSDLSPEEWARAEARLHVLLGR